MDKLEQPNSVAAMNFPVHPSGLGWLPCLPCPLCRTITRRLPVVCQHVLVSHIRRG